MYGIVQSVYTDTERLSIVEDPERRRYVDARAAHGFLNDVVREAKAEGMEFIRNSGGRVAVKFHDESGEYVRVFEVFEW